MYEFDPPIENRLTNELISIANSSTYYWQKEAIEAAKAELARRGVSGEEQQTILDQWKKLEAFEEQERQKQLQKHVDKKYKSSDKIKLLLFGFEQVLGYSPYVPQETVSELKQDNLQEMARERTFLLTLSVLLRFFVFAIVIFFLKY